MNDRTVAGSPHWRLIGGALMLVSVLSYQPGTTGVLQQLLLPLAMAVGTALIVRNLLAILITAALLAFIQTRWGQLFSIGDSGSDWIATTAYPLLAIGCTLWAAYILRARFRGYMQATAEARNARREQAQRPDDD